MKCILKKIILFSGLLLSMLFTGTTIAQFQLWEIPDPNLPEIAMIRADPNWGSAVIYNSDTCKQIGDACGFFRRHASAHAELNHLLLPPAAYPASTEAKADCWAAKYGKPHEVLAAVQLFLEEGSNTKWKIHGDPIQRAEKVRDCAKQADNWIGN